MNIGNEVAITAAFGLWSQCLVYVSPCNAARVDDMQMAMSTKARNRFTGETSCDSIPNATQPRVPLPAAEISAEACRGAFLAPNRPRTADAPNRSIETKNEGLKREYLSLRLRPRVSPTALEGSQEWSTWTRLDGRAGSPAHRNRQTVHSHKRNRRKE